MSEVFCGGPCDVTACARAGGCGGQAGTSLTPVIAPLDTAVGDQQSGYAARGEVAAQWRERALVRGAELRAGGSDLSAGQLRRRAKDARRWAERDAGRAGPS